MSRPLHASHAAAVPALLWLADAQGLSGTERLTVTPPADGEVIVAVDGAAPAAAGPFTIGVSWQ